MNHASPRTADLDRTVRDPALLVLVTVAGGWAVGYRVNLKTASVPVPAAAAAPEQVVLAYLQA